MMDVLMVETGSGGDLVYRDGDIVANYGVENMPYLSMFGGGIDWWGNSLLMPNTPFQATTEELLNTVVLNSAGRASVQATMDKDLSTFTGSIPDTTYTVSVTIPSVNTCQADIQINGQTFYFLWNPDKLFLNYKLQ